jgi:hypothetical protein
MSLSSTTSFPAIAGACTKLGEFPARKSRRLCLDGGRLPIRSVRGSAERSREGIDGRSREGGESGGRGGFTSPAMEVTTFDQSFRETEFPVWEKIGAVVRLSYGIGLFHSFIHFFDLFVCFELFNAILLICYEVRVWCKHATFLFLFPQKQ